MGTDVRELVELSGARGVLVILSDAFYTSDG